MTPRKDIEEAARAYALRAYGCHMSDEGDLHSAVLDYLAGTDFMQPEIQAALHKGFEAGQASVHGTDLKYSMTLKDYIQYEELKKDKLVETVKEVIVTKDDL